MINQRNGSNVQEVVVYLQVIIGTFVLSINLHNNGNLTVTSLSYIIQLHHTVKSCSYKSDITLINT